MAAKARVRVAANCGCDGVAGLDPGRGPDPGALCQGLENQGVHADGGCAWGRVTKKQATRKLLLAWHPNMSTSLLSCSVLGPELCSRGGVTGSELLRLKGPGLSNALHFVANVPFELLRSSATSTSS